MKNILKNLTLLLTIFALTGCAATQELREGASFEGKNTFYVKAPQGGGATLNALADRGKASNEVLVETIKNFLAERGYTYVDSPNAAQIIFLPIWVSGAENVNVGATMSTTASHSSVINYVTLEIQAFFPDSDLWQWRGLSSLQVTSFAMNEGKIQQSVYWSLGEFPPEQYPSNLSEHRAKQEEERQAAENPFSHIVVEAPAQPAVETAPAAE